MNLVSYVQETGFISIKCIFFNVSLIYLIKQHSKPSKKGAKTLSTFILLY